MSRIDDIVERTTSLAARTARTDCEPVRKVIAYALEKWTALQAQMSLGTFTR
ncbi:MAG TPA: hypothetical protein VLY04_06630 [Bryobacteraceae bacterium]|nr:hypothetical protein [Bryobacteraceae bacterium]